MSQVEIRAMRTRLGVSRPFAEDRRRGRQRMALGIALGIVFAAAFGRVYLATVVADRVGRVHSLEKSIEQVSTDLSIASVQLDARRAYVDLERAARATGLALGGPRAEVPLPRIETERTTLTDELAQDLRRGSQLVLTEALASTRPAEKVRASVR